MYSFLICDLKNELSKKEIVNQISNCFKNADINFLCTDKKQKKSNKYNLIIFDKIINDDIAINSCFKLMKFDKVFVIRSGFKDFHQLESFKNFNEDYDILMLKNQNKLKKQGFLSNIKNFFKKLYYNLFSYNFYEGNLSCVLFNKNASNVLKQLDNPAPYTKVDKWIGMNIKYILTNTNKFIPQISFREKWQNLYFTFLLFVMSLVSTIFIFDKVFFAIKMFLLFITLLLFAISLFFTVRVYTFSKIGKIENRTCEFIFKSKGD